MTNSHFLDFSKKFFENSELFFNKSSYSEKKVGFGKAVVNVRIPTSITYKEDAILNGLIGENESDYKHQATISIFDDRFGSYLPTGKWPSDLHYPLGLIKESLTTPYKIAIDRHTSTVSVFDTNKKRCSVWIKDITKLPYWAIATPFRLQLSWIANTFGAELTHAAALELNGNGLLISGASGVGKSTASILSSQKGFNLIGDDYVLIDGKKVSAVYTRAKLHDSALELPDMNKLIVLNPGIPNQKRIIDLYASKEIKLSNSALIKGIALPIFADMSAFQPLSSGKALKMIAPASLSGLLGGSASSLIRLRNLVSSVPTYRWAISGDNARDIEMLKEIFRVIQ